jgi:hypothetical protein
VLGNILILSGVLLGMLGLWLTPNTFAAPMKSLSDVRFGATPKARVMGAGLALMVGGAVLRLLGA